MKDALKNLHFFFKDKYRLIALVFDKKLYAELPLHDVEFIEFKYPKKSWLLRIWFEYVHCFFISKKLNAFFWFAIHDMTPNVKCNNKAVYCHNPSAFYMLSTKEIIFEKSLLFFQLFYKFFYKINLNTNNYVIVQQNWLRHEFEQKLHAKNVVVAYPNITIEKHAADFRSSQTTFIFPSLARVFKNFEVLFEAGNILSKMNSDFKILVTISGNENKYATYLRKKFQHVQQIKFMGVQPRQKIFELYAESSCLIFPSRLETWGLPITEMKSFNKPIFVARRPYAYETVGNYDKVCFFDENNPQELATLMDALIKNNIVFDRPKFKQPEQPFTNNWLDLFSLMLNQN